MRNFTSYTSRGDIINAGAVERRGEEQWCNGDRYSISVKEPCIPAKEPYVLAKVPYTLGVVSQYIYVYTYTYIHTYIKALCSSKTDLCFIGLLSGVAKE